LADAPSAVSTDIAGRGRTGESLSQFFREQRQTASPLARKPYDFRHAGVSWRLSSGVPGPKVAEWAGHSVEILYRVYAHCLDGEDDRWYERMERALG
jgi:integrase